MKLRPPTTEQIRERERYAAYVAEHGPPPDELTQLRARVAKLEAVLREVVDKCPVCDGNGIAAQCENEVSWDEPCRFCAAAREALEGR